MKPHALIIHLLCLASIAACTDDPMDTDGESSETDGDDESMPTTGEPDTCGDGQVDPGEECDEGPDNGPDGLCSSACTMNECSDALALIARTPAGEGRAMAASTAISLTFTCAVDQATVNDDTVFVHGSQTGRRTFTVEWSGATATLVLAEPLLPAERVDVTLTAGIRDTSGGPSSPQVFHFTVSSGPGAGTFTATPAEIGQDYVALGDLDGDLDVDVVRATGAAFLNSGTGEFSEVNYGSSGEQVALGDLDGDGDLDIMSAGGFGGLSSETEIFINDGAGNFTAAPIQAELDGMDTFGLADVDGDGDLDAWAVTATTNAADLIALNDGTGVFSVATSGLGSNATYALAFADVDADGFVDALVGNGNIGDPATIWLGDGLGGFTDAGVGLGGGPHGQNGLALADLDGDAAADAVILQYFDGAGQIWLNDTTGSFTPGAALGIERVFGTLARDIDGDGDVDLVAACDDFFVEANYVLLNAGDGTVTITPFGSGGEATAMGDLDGDGIVDLLVDDELFVGG